jgi:hypothetical protein
MRTAALALDCDAADGVSCVDESLCKVLVFGVAGGSDGGVSVLLSFVDDVIVCKHD